MLDQVAETIRRHGMFRPGQKVGVAVSGGADSVALLHSLAELAPRWALDLRVLHLNHQLRGAESDGDAEFVENVAASLGLGCETRRVRVAQLATDTGDNLEQAARLARRRFFLDLVQQGKLDRVATGHTRSDQAETVLGRLLRGSGTAGLAGIRPVIENIVRPLIEVTRDEVERFLSERSIQWREDSSNADQRFDRNRLRHQLLPQLAKQWNPAIEETLARMATIAASEEAYWQTEVDRLSAELVQVRGTAIVVDCAQLRRLHPAAARRLLRYAVERVKGDLRRIEFTHVEDLLTLATSQAGDGRRRIPGLEAVRSFDSVRLAPPEMEPPPEDYRLPLPVPGHTEIPCGELIHCEAAAYHAEKQGYNVARGWKLDWGRIPGSLEVRNWRPGDRFQPAGASKERKMKELFQQARIPSWERAGWPMITSGDTIIWTRRFGAAQGFAPPPNASRVLLVWETGSARSV